MAAVTKRIADESFFAHLEPFEGVGYDCLSLVTRATGKSTRVRFQMNRNGINSNILEEIWFKAEPEWLGVEGVAEQLIENAKLTRKRSDNSDPSIACRVSTFVSTWIDQNMDEEFYVGPIYWPGSCASKTDSPIIEWNNEIWPLKYQSPELILGVRGVETMRVYMQSAVVSDGTNTFEIPASS